MYFTFYYTNNNYIYLLRKGHYKANDIQIPMYIQNK